MGDELKTERFELRRFRPGDDASLDYIEDEQWRRYLSADFPDAAAFAQNSLEEEDGLNYAIVAGDELVGSVHLGGGRVGELACLIRPAWWGRGVAPEVCARVIDHAFRNTQVERVYARCHAGNEKSIRAMEKLGLTREGTLRRHRVDRSGELVDEHWYGVLREEWMGRE